MTQSFDSPSTTADGSSSTTDVAKDEARSVGQSTAQAGKQVAGTAAEQAQQVTQETRRQAQDLLAQGRSQATEQARNGQQKAAGSLSALADEMRTLTDGEGGSGPAHDLVRQATDAVEGLAGHLRDREPGDLLEDVRSFARRRPGMFLLGAAVAGVVAGRLTTGVVAAHKDQSSSAPTTRSRPARVHCPAVPLPATPPSRRSPRPPVTARSTPTPSPAGTPSPPRTRSPTHTRSRRPTRPAPAGRGTTRPPGTPPCPRRRTAPRPRSTRAPTRNSFGGRP